MSDDSVAKDLHQTSRYLHNQWHSESAAYILKHMTAVHAEDGPAVME